MFKTSGTVLGKADFLGLNYYTSSYITNKKPVASEEVSFVNDQELNIESDVKWPQANLSWLFYVPEGLREILKYVMFKIIFVQVM